MKEINFKATKQDAAIIKKIATRALEGKKASSNVKTDLCMDITATHLNGCPLRLKDWLAADDFNFMHDIYGIRENLNRKTGKLKQFWPRFAVKQ